MTTPYRRYEMGGRAPDADMTNLVNRFETEAFDPNTDEGRAVMAAVTANRAKRDEATERIKSDLATFVAEVNRAFAVAVKCEFEPRSGRRIEGRDGVERVRSKFYAYINLGPVDNMRVPGLDEAEFLGAKMAADIRAEYPGMTAASYAGSAPISILGSMWTGESCKVTPTVEGDYAETMIGMYFAPIAFKETK